MVDPKACAIHILLLFLQWKQMGFLSIDARITTKTQQYYSGLIIIRMQVMEECQQTKPNELGCMAASYAEVTSDNGHGDHWKGVFHSRAFILSVFGIQIQIGWNAVLAPKAEVACKVRLCSFRVGVCCKLRFCIALIALDKLLLWKDDRIIIIEHTLRQPITGERKVFHA